MSLLRNGGPGLALAVLALLAAAGLAGVLRPAWLSEAEHLHKAYDIATRQTALAIRQGPLPQTTTAQSDAGNRLAALLALAARHGVPVANTQQRLVPARTGELGYVVVTLHAKASYEPLRAFVQAALQADAALALDSLRLRRSRVEDSALQTEMSWVLRLQPAPAEVLP